MYNVNGENISFPNESVMTALAVKYIVFIFIINLKTISYKFIFISLDS